MKRREIFIELTSLLDVILIMLFVVISQAKFSTDKVVDASEAAKAELAAVQSQMSSVRQELDEALLDKAELQYELEDMQRHEISIGIVEENSLIITLSLQQRDARYILVEEEWGGELSIPLEGQDENYLSNKLRSTVMNMMKESGMETVFVVFQYDRSSIYQAEYSLISTVVRELKAEAKEMDIALNYIETDILEG